jgi:hypothetical protein
VTSRCKRAKSAAVGGGGSAAALSRSLSAAMADMGANATIIAIPKRTHLGKFLACIMSNLGRAQ